MTDPFYIEPKRLKEVRAFGRIVVSMSGGKDSAAAGLLLEHHGIPFDRVFMDTGWEHPATYAYIRDVLEPRFGPVETIRSEPFPDGMVELVRHKRVFPSRHMRFCTEFLKWRPFKKWIEQQDDDDVLHVVGIRHAESEARSKMAELEYDEAFDCEVWRPLVRHTFEDVILMHQLADLAPNPLYLDGASRVGCFPCIFSRKSEVAAVERLWPGRVEQIYALEQELTAAEQAKFVTDVEYRAKVEGKAFIRCGWLAAKDDHEQFSGGWKDWRKEDLSDEDLALRATYIEAARDEYDATDPARFSRGEPRENRIDVELGRQLRRTFFHGRREADDSILQIVEWATSDRHGQLKLFDKTASDGCMRWGLCDTGHEPLVQVRTVMDAEEQAVGGGGADLTERPHGCLTQEQHEGGLAVAERTQAFIERCTQTHPEPRDLPLEPDDGRNARGLGGPCLGHACNCIYDGEPCGERQ